MRHLHNNSTMPIPKFPNKADDAFKFFVSNLTFMTVPYFFL